MTGPAVRPPATGNVVEFSHVTKRFGGLTVIRDVTFSVPDLPEKGEFIAILGRRGAASPPCARLIAGLPPHHPPTEGRCWWRPACQRPGSDRSMVFQGLHLLRPMRTVEDNVAFGLECRGVWRRSGASAREWMLGRPGRERDATSIRALSGRDAPARRDCARWCCRRGSS